MAKRKEAKGKPPQEKTKAETGRATEVVPGYGELLNLWTTFSEQMGKQITENMVTQQKEWEKLMGVWTKTAQEIGKQVTLPETSEKTMEFYDIWRNYVNKFGSRMTSATNEGLNNYLKLLESWQKYSEEWNKQMANLATGSRDFRIENLYETWLGFSTTFGNLLRNFNTYANKEYEELSTIWNDFSAKLTEVCRTISDDTTSAYKGLTDLWLESSKEISNVLADFVKGTNDDYEKLQNTWVEYTTKIGKEMTNIARSIGTSYEELYRNLLERGVPSIVTAPRGSSVEREIEILKAKVRELEERLRALGK